MPLWEQWQNKRPILPRHLSMRLASIFLYQKRESLAGQDFVGEARARGYSPTITPSDNNSNNKSLADWPG